MLDGSEGAKFNRKWRKEKDADYITSRMRIRPMKA